MLFACHTENTKHRKVCTWDEITNKQNEEKNGLLWKELAKMANINVHSTFRFTMFMVMWWCEQEFCLVVLLVILWHSLVFVFLLTSLSHLLDTSTERNHKWSQMYFVWRIFYALSLLFCLFLHNMDQSWFVRGFHECEWSCVIWTYWDIVFALTICFSHTHTQKLCNEKLYASFSWTRIPN